MKIKQLESEEEFQAIGFGGTFKHKGGFFVKADSNGISNFNALNLESGVLVSFSTGDRVIPITGHFVQED